MSGLLRNQRLMTTTLKAYNKGQFLMQCGVTNVLEARGPSTCKDIAEALDSDLNIVTALMTRMVKLGIFNEELGVFSL